MAKPFNVVLVHGGFVDGSGWREVYRGLKRDGYAVAAFRTRPHPWPTTSRRPGSSSRSRTVP
jgi:hypothetical protein